MCWKAPSGLRTPTKINDSTLAIGAIQGQMENSLKQNTLKIMVSPSIMNSCNDSHIYWNAFTTIHKTPKLIIARVRLQPQCCFM